MQKGLIIGIVVAVAVVAVIVGFMSSGDVTGNIAKIEKAQYTCTDSDGNLTREESYFVRGSTERTWTESGKVQKGEDDECLSGRIKEWYCDNRATIKSKTKSCANGCANGACLR
jgi:hypothetical protein